MNRKVTGVQMNSYQIGYDVFLKEDRAKKGWCLLWQMSVVFCECNWTWINLIWI
jgi:hypothetical protein